LRDYAVTYRAEGIGGCCWNAWTGNWLGPGLHVCLVREEPEAKDSKNTAEKGGNLVQCAVRSVQRLRPRLSRAIGQRK